MSVSFATIRYAVACWLRYGKQCSLVSFERGGMGWAWGYPDIFAVTESRKTYDVEIKMSFSDFKADAKKAKFRPELQNINDGKPTWFYYACDEALGEKILPLLPDGAGLLVVTGFQEIGQDGVRVVKSARANKGKKPSLNQMVTWVKDQSGTFCGMAKQISQLMEQAHALH